MAAVAMRQLQVVTYDSCRLIAACVGSGGLRVGGKQMRTTTTLMTPTEGFDENRHYSPCQG